MGDSGRGGKGRRARVSQVSSRAGNTGTHQPRRPPGSSAAGSRGRVFRSARVVSFPSAVCLCRLLSLFAWTLCVRCKTCILTVPSLIYLRRELASSNWGAGEVDGHR